MNMTTEPIRLPALLVALLLIGGPPAIASLLGQDWRIAVASALSGLIASGGVIGVAESRRARTDSPATVEARFSDAQARAELSYTPAEVPVDLSQPPVEVDPAALDLTREQVAELVRMLEARQSGPTGL